MKRKILRLLLIFTMIFAIVPVLTSVALADSVSYLDADGMLKPVTEYTTITDSMSTTWTSGWYVLSSNVTIEEPIQINGDVRLLLRDGCTLTMNLLCLTGTSKIKACMQLDDTNDSLTIYGQSAQTGTLNIQCNDGAAINVQSGQCTINSGTVIAKGGGKAAAIGGNSAASCGDITINGGNVTASGDQLAAGIGGGNQSVCGVITINGGSVQASGGDGGCGIGNGAESAQGGTIIINGGTVTATGSSGSAGIGGSSYGYAASVSIYGGSVKATGGTNSYSNNGGAGIGSGAAGKTGSITISGGSVQAFGGMYSAGIGGGFLSDSAAVSISGGSISATAGSSASIAIGEGYWGDKKGATLISLPGPGRIKAGSDEASAQEVQNPGTDMNAVDGFRKTYVSVQAAVCRIGETLYFDLNSAVTAAAEQDTVRLCADCNLSAPVSVGSSKNFTLDLNGYAISGAYIRSKANTTLLTNAGTLTVTDSRSGSSDGDAQHYFLYRESGAWEHLPFPTSAQKSSAVPYADMATSTCISGETVIQISGGCMTGGGALSGNGGAIRNTGTLTLQNITILGNTASHGGGIYSEHDITLSGNVRICGNYNGNAEADNLYLTSGKQITLSAFDTASAVGITLAPGYGVLTGSCSENCLACFTYDKSDALVKFNTDHLEVVHIPVVFTVTSSADAHEDGKRTLREALEQMGDYDVIEFADDVKTITLDTVLQIQNQHITIDGGENGVTLDGSSKTNILSVSGQTGTTIYGITFTNGKHTTGNTYGGAISCTNAGLTLIDCRFENNHGFNGGAVGIYDDTATDETYLFLRCEFRDNQADQFGGAIFTYNGQVTLTNCLIADNAAKCGGGGLFFQNNNHTINNCTIVGNSVTNNTHENYCGSAIRQIKTSSASSQPTTTINNSILLQNTGGYQEKELSGDGAYSLHACLGTPGNWGSTVADAACLTYDTAKPTFVDADNGDYHLLHTAQAFSSGNNALIPSGITTDLDGNTRILEDIVDMGCYESHYSDSSWTGSTLTLTLHHDTDAVTTYDVLAACYNAQGQLIALLPKSVSLEKGKDSTITFDFSDITDCATVKTFLLECDTFLPVIPKIEYSMS